MIHPDSVKRYLAESPTRDCLPHAQRQATGDRPIKGSSPKFLRRKEGGGIIYTHGAHPIIQTFRRPVGATGSDGGAADGPKRISCLEGGLGSLSIPAPL